MRTRTLAAAAALLLAAVAHAQTTDPAAPATPAVQIAGTEPAPAGATRDQDTLSVDFPDEEIRTILRNVADLFELNLVVPDTLVGRTSIKLRDVTWRQIFQVVLAPVGYTYLEEGNIIKILSNETLTQEPVATEVFILNNAKAGDIKPTIDGLVDAAAGGRILVDSRSNALVVTERPSRMSRIRTIIEQLDKATAQVMIESKFVEVTDRDIRNIGVNWASLQGMQLGVGGISQNWQRGRDQTFTRGVDASSGTTNNAGRDASLTNSTNNTVINGTTNSTTNANTSTNSTGFSVVPNNIDPNTGAFGTATLNLPSGAVTNLPATVGSSAAVNDFRPAIPAAGTTPAQPMSFTVPVSNTTTVTSGTSSGTTGSTEATARADHTITDTLANTASSAVNNLLGLTNGGTQSRLATAVFSASDFNVIVSALNSQNNTRILSNPTVVTLNNTEAMLNIGQEFPVPNYTYNAERGTFEVSGFTYKPIGVLLRVTPQVNAQGNIRLALEPEISQQSGSTTFGGAGGASIPVIATRKVRTQVSLKDGYTAGIGGLITTQKDHGGTRVPVIGSIPVLGRLFSSRNVNDATSNLLIFITAKTVNPDGAAPEQVFSAESLEAVGLTPRAQR